MNKVMVTIGANCEWMYGRTVAINPSMLCRFWTGVPGSCKNGDKCPFGHSTTIGFEKPNGDGFYEYVVFDKRYKFAPATTDDTTMCRSIKQENKHEEFPPGSSASERSTVTVKDVKTIKDSTGEVVSRKRTRWNTDESGSSIGEKKPAVTSRPVTSPGASDCVTHPVLSGSVTCPSTNRYKELCDSLADSLNRLEKEDNKQLAMHMITLYKLLADVELSLSLSLT